MQTINVGNKRLIAVTVPEESRMLGYGIRFDRNLGMVVFYEQGFPLPTKMQPIPDDCIKLHFSKNDYNIIGFVRSLREDQWTGIVETVATMGKKGTESYAALWRNYLHEIPQHVFLTCNTATESGHSLLQKHGVDPENTLIIEII